MNTIYSRSRHRKSLRKNYLGNTVFIFYRFQLLMGNNLILHTSSLNIDNNLNKNNIIC